MNNQLHFKRYLVLLIAVLVTALFAAVPVSAASKATKNKKAVALYEKKSKKLDLRDKKYVDITGDGIKEGIFIYNTGKSGSGRVLRIYTYKKGKIKSIFKIEAYGFSKLIVYKKSKAFILYSAGHGGETYRYYKMSNGKYKEVASKGRQGVKGGAFKNGPWEYSTHGGGSYRQLSKSEFNSLIQGIKKGKKTKVKLLFY